jgi:hypothetical protein
MGRPINFKKIGGNTSAAGQQLLLSAWFTGEGAPEPAFVVKQTASRSFLLASVSTPSRIGEFRLGNTAVQGETAILESLPFGKTMSNGFAIATATLTTGGATTLADGDYDLEYVSGSPAPENDDPSDLPIIKLTVSGGEFVAIVSIVQPGRFLTNPVNAVLTFSSATDVQTPPTLTIATTTELFVPAIENVRKITQHRVVTFDGNAYKYEVGVAAALDGEADIRTA